MGRLGNSLGLISRKDWHRGRLESHKSHYMKKQQTPTEKAVKGFWILIGAFLILITSIFTAGCATTKQFDYEAYQEKREHPYWLKQNTSLFQSIFGKKSDPRISTYTKRAETYQQLKEEAEAEKALQEQLKIIRQTENN